MARKAKTLKTTQRKIERALKYAVTELDLDALAAELHMMQAARRNQGRMA